MFKLLISFESIGIKDAFKVVYFMREHSCQKSSGF